MFQAAWCSAITLLHAVHALQLFGTISSLVVPFRHIQQELQQDMVNGIRGRQVCEEEAPQASAKISACKIACK
jgi:hypothetical protein